MNVGILQLLFLIFELVVTASISLYMISLILSSVMGAPYVPTSQKDVKKILEEAQLKKNSTFLELGCGDGRIVRTAVQKYGVKGLGVDINPIVLTFARMWTYFQKLKEIKFIQKNILNISFREYDTIYIFLMPEFIRKIEPKMSSEIPQTSLVISHWFKIPGWDKYLRKTVSGKRFATYFYQKQTC